MKRNLLIVFLSLTVSLSYADNWLIRFMKQLGETDTTYIEPQHYPGMLMLPFCLLYAALIALSNSSAATSMVILILLPSSFSTLTLI